MQKICFFYKNIINIGYLSSSLMMGTWVTIFYFLFFSRIKTIKELLYPITSIPSAIYTVLTQNEPSVLIIFIAILIWISIMLLPVWIDNKLVCYTQFIYAFISMILASIVIVGKTF